MFLEQLLKKIDAVKQSNTIGDKQPSVIEVVKKNESRQPTMIGTGYFPPQPCNEEVYDLIVDSLGENPNYSYVTHCFSQIEIPDKKWQQHIRILLQLRK